MMWNDIKASDFGPDFIFGTAASAFQTEGAWNEDGKGVSIWDVFAQRRKIRRKGNAQTACDFYHRFEDDVKLMQLLGLRHFRFSIAWTRIFPDGHGTVNQKGIDFYKRLVECLRKHDIEPWITLFHWDLPQALQEKGGWANRDTVFHFCDYVNVFATHFKNDVNNWMVLNEPLAFTFLGYMLGWHAPGKRSPAKFCAAVHHAMLAQALGGRALKSVSNSFFTGTTHSCTYIEPVNEKEKNIRAARVVDALLNRLYIEPLLGMGYPFSDLKFLQRIETYMKPGDEKNICFDYDFIGIQNYSREIVRYHPLVPFIKSINVPPSKRNADHTQMNWEVYPDSIYRMVKKYAAYETIKKIIITENGAAFDDSVIDGKIIDERRKIFLQQYLAKVLQAKKDVPKLNGYFLWSFTDNFEWAEGITPRFGIVHVDYNTQQRLVKNSGWWYSQFLER